MKKWWATDKMTQNQKLVVPSFPISSNCKKEGMKMCYDCAPKTISPPSFWVHGFFILRKKFKKLTPDRRIQILELWGTHVHIVWGQHMCILWHVYRLFMPTRFYMIFFRDLFAHLYGPDVRWEGESSISILFLSKRCLTWVHLQSNVWTL
jgi:hypothetical protein